MDLTQLVVDAFATGAVAAMKDTASAVVKQAFEKLKARFASHYPQISSTGVENKPDSPTQRDALKESLDDAGANSDPELRDLALALIEAIRTHDPEAATTVGVDLARIKASEINIAGIKASGGSTAVKAADIDASTLNIQDVETHGNDSDHP